MENEEKNVKENNQQIDQLWKEIIPTINKNKKFNSQQQIILALIGHQLDAYEKLRKQLVENYKIPLSAEVKEVKILRQKIEKNEDISP